VRAPRQLLQGEERQQVIQMVEHALETRLDLSKYNL
ncbi:dihydrodipicolinate synthase family protein, partial [Vibrio parahaemolyticus]|nr:dihydrodipicolinate synthase family protein [Vibrio parahaemolyticus]